MDSASSSIVGPCCHSARLAVDHAGVQKANTSAIRIDWAIPRNRLATTYMTTLARATMSEAISSSAIMEPPTRSPVRNARRKSLPRAGC